MRKIYSLAVLLAMLLAGTNTVKAQDYNFHGEVTVGYYASQNWASTPITFKLSEVATALGTDAATLDAQLSASYPTDVDDYDPSAVTVKVIAIQPSGDRYDGTVSGFTTAELAGYYMTIDGDPKPYSEAMWYTVLTWDLENDELTFLAGRHAEKGEEGATCQSFQILSYNGNEVIFSLTYTIEAKPEAQEIEKQLSKLTMVSGTTVEVTQSKRSGYDADLVEVPVPTLISDLGYGSYTDLILNDALFTQMYKLDALSGQYTWEDSITNEFTANAPGFWFGPTYSYTMDQYEEWVTESDSVNLAVTRYDGGDPLFYAEAFAFNRTDGNDVITFNLGQFGGKASDAGQEYRATVYVVNGTIAYPINIILTITPTDHSADPNLATYEKAGEVVITDDKAYNSGYLSVHLPIDAEAIAAAMGAESPRDLQLWVRTAAGGNDLIRFDDGTPSGSTQWVDEGVMWINTDGVQSSWGSSSAFMVSYQQLSDGTYTIGVMDMPGGQIANDPSTVTVSLFLCNPATQQYYEIILVREQPQVDIVPMDQWTRMSVITANISILTGSAQPGTYELPWAKICEDAGVSSGGDLVLYAQRQVSGEEDDIAYIGDGLTYTKSYTCTPHPGFWMDSDGKYPAAWGSTCAYGWTLDYTSGLVTWYSYNETTRSPGDRYNSTFYLVDETTGKYVQLSFNITFVDEIVPVNVVGEMDIALPWDADDLDYDYNSTFTYVDLTDVYEKLEIDESEIVSCDWYIEKDGTYFKADDILPEFNVFDENGFVGTIDEDVELYETGVFSIGFDYLTEIAFGVSALANEEWVGGVYQVNMAAENPANGKRYVFHIYTGPKELVDAINGIVADKDTKTEVFDLAGRRVAAPVKGLYILNGKKVLVK